MHHELATNTAANHTDLVVICHHGLTHFILPDTLSPGKEARGNDRVPAPPPKSRHLVLSHRAKVVVSKEDTKFTLLGSRCELAQAVVGQLGCSGLQELLGNQACQNEETRRVMA